MRITYRSKPEKSDKSVEFIWAICPYCGKENYFLQFDKVISFCASKKIYSIGDHILKNFAGCFAGCEDLPTYYLVLGKCEHFKEIKFGDIVFLSPEFPDKKKKQGEQNE